MYQLKTEQFVKTDLASCWTFFSSPKNLQKITPSSMGFIIKTEVPNEMYNGLMIEYTVKPVLGIPLKWITEIKCVEDQMLFVDEQRKGPYKIWHHEHHFEAVDGGVLMKDIISYELPLGFLGKIMHSLFVKKQLNTIFEYRKKAIDQIFP